MIILTACSNTASVDVKNETIADSEVTFKDAFEEGREIQQKEIEQVPEGYKYDVGTFHNIEFHGDKIFARYDWENPEEYTDVNLEQWSDDGSVLWCSLRETYVTIAYVAIKTNTWNTEKYNEREFGSEEYILNPNTGWVAYSDYPVALDIIAFDEYMESGRMTTLYIYNLLTKEERVIDASKTNKFEPQWSDDGDELLYYIGYKCNSYDMDIDK